MKNFDMKELELLSKNVRKNIINLSTGSGTFTGAALSCSDLICYLYNNYLNISPQTVKSNDRDYFLLSKGHSVAALYSVMAELGFFEKRDSIITYKQMILSIGIQIQIYQELNFIQVHWDIHFR